MTRFLEIVIKAILIITMPFILLIRGSVIIHGQKDFRPLISLAGGMLLTGMALFIFLSVIHVKMTGRIGKVRSFKRRAYLSLSIVLAFIIHAIFFISGNHFKNEALRKEFHELHPILRLSLSTLVHLDRSLIITDASRKPEDYRKMGLEAKSESLHYRQHDGYTYAVDLRTSGRTEFRNFLTATYFKIMGFRTLRHDETGDHLHISLKNHFLPDAR